MYTLRHIPKLRHLHVYVDALIVQPGNTKSPCHSQYPIVSRQRNKTEHKLAPNEAEKACSYGQEEFKRNH